MRPDSLNGVITSLHFSDDCVQLIAVERAAVANLSAGFRIKRSVIEDDLAFFAGLEFLHALSILDDGQHFATLGALLQIAFESRFRELLVCRVGRLLGRTFPRGAGALALLRHGAVETGLIECESLISSSVLHEI